MNGSSSTIVSTGIEQTLNITDSRKVSCPRRKIKHLCYVHRVCIGDFASAQASWEARVRLPQTSQVFLFHPFPAEVAAATCVDEPRDRTQTQVRMGIGTQTDRLAVLNMIQKVTRREWWHVEAQVGFSVFAIVDVHPDLSLRVKAFLISAGIWLQPEAHARVLADGMILGTDAHCIYSAVASRPALQYFANVQTDSVHAHSRDRNEKTSRQSECRRIRVDRAMFTSTNHSAVFQDILS